MKRPQPSHYNPPPMFGLRAWWRSWYSISARDIAAGCITADKLAVGCVDDPTGELERMTADLVHDLRPADPFRAARQFQRTRGMLPIDGWGFP